MRSFGEECRRTFGHCRLFRYSQPKRNLCGVLDDKPQTVQLFMDSDFCRKIQPWIVKRSRHWIHLQSSFIYLENKWILMFGFYRVGRAYSWEKTRNQDTERWRRSVRRNKGLDNTRYRKQRAFLWRSFPPCSLVGHVDSIYLRIHRAWRTCHAKSRCSKFGHSSITCPGWRAWRASWCHGECCASQQKRLYFLFHSSHGNVVWLGPTAELQRG